MTVLTTTKTRERVCLTKCPPWCVADHPVTARNRFHRSAGTTTSHGLRASVYWTERNVPPFLDEGPEIRLSAGDRSITLGLGEAVDLAGVLAELGGEENARAADLLRSTFAMVVRGVSR